jgi:UDP-2,3-diacylglucosamine hydrolase
MALDRPASALFVSDLHLSDERPATTGAFLAFLRGPARLAGALYILGDLFEYWAGDDDADAPLNLIVGAALAELVATGVEVFFLPGNRDFLLGAQFARDTGLRILPDPTTIEAAGTRLLLTHGDTLCTDDRAYQAYRAQVREPRWQEDFLNRPLAERKQFIEALRHRSEAAKQEKALEIMDVNPAAVQDLLREYAYPVLIHGHTHRPAHHIHFVDGHRCERWVLADWHDDAPYLRWDASGPQALRFAPETGS